MWTPIKFWTEVPFLFLGINEVPSTIQNEPQWTKNKIVKPQGGQTYLTIISNTNQIP
jgi:hypothetical protein